MRWRKAFLILFLSMPALGQSASIDPMLSTGRAPDSTAKTLSEIRAAERRRVPLEVMLQASTRYAMNDPVVVTIVVTNLFDTPLLLNTRMLVNHPRLEGELAFLIKGPDGKKVEFERLVTPLSIRDQDFVVLGRGQSIQRSVDLSDLYGMTQKGTYEIRVFYHNEVDFSSDSRRAWRGIVWSEPVEIELQ